MVTAQAENELKQQGAIEAAGDPATVVTSDDAQRKIVEESKKAGVTAFTFDPDASPEEKKAQLRASLPEGMPTRSKGVAIVTDIDDGSKPVYDLPSATRDGVVRASSKGEDGQLEQANGGAGGGGDAGGEEQGGGAEMGEQTGWAPRFGWPVDPGTESLLDHTTWLESRIPDKFYGDWYHNAAIIVFACISSWLVAVLGGGLAWVFIVMAFCATYYRTSIRRVRRNFRDDITRELSLKRLETDTESLEWINAFMLKFWPIYQPVLAQTIINSVDQVLSSATPAFLDSLKLKTFTLGSKPPRMEHVKTLKAEDDEVIMDWKFNFTPNDTADMTQQQLKYKVNPKVVLEIRVGKAMISKGLDVIVEDMAFSGVMRLKIKLQIPFPHIEKVDMCFLGKPTIDYVCKPLGGDTFGFDINFIPGLESFILEQIHGNLAPMMYEPNVFPIEVAKMLAGTPVDQAIGVVAVTLHGAQGLRNPDNFSGTPDPYAVLSLNRRAPLAQTKTVKENASPRWDETHYVIVTSLNDSLDIQVFDYNEFRKDKELGVASFHLEQVEAVAEYENERLELIHDGKPRGIVSCDIRFFPVLETKKLPDGTMEELPEANTGILRFTVEQAKDLDASGMLNPYAVLLLNGKEVHQTTKKKRTNKPIWENGSKEILITDRKRAKLGVVVKDDRDIGGDAIIGSYQIRLEDMLEFMAKGQEWYNLANVRTGRVKMTAQWKPVAISGISTGTGGYVTPTGVMRFHFKSAKELRNFEKLGKSDPYVRVVMSGIERARTVTFKNNLNPEWDEVLYVPVHSARERLQLEVMDAENVGRDRSLGLVEVFTKDFMTQDENGEWQVNDANTLRQDGLRLHGKGIAKGILNYTVAFYPCINVADPEDEDEKDKAWAEERKASLEVPRSAEPGKFTSLAERKDNAVATDLTELPPVSPASVKSPVSPASIMSSRRSRDDSKGPRKVHLTPQELLQHESGMVIFKLMNAELPHNDLRVEVHVDDMAFPSYVSSVAKKHHHKFDEIGDCFIRELEFSRMTIKICERSDKNEGRENKTVAKLTGNTLDTLKQCLNNPTTLKMRDDDGQVYSVKVSLKYVPVRMQLDPSESINNMGNLRVDVLDAENLPSADRNGKSDPYAKFELNGLEVFKTKVQKKTLNPSWNEFFEVAIPSRTAANFRATVWDWDFADKPDYLGSTDVNLAQLDPFKAQELRLALDGKSGTIRLRLLFRPDYVTRMRQGTSTLSGTFSVPGRIVTGVAGVPVKGVGMVGHGVGKGASFLKRGILGKKKEDEADVAAAPAGLAPPAEIPTITTNGFDGSSPPRAPPGIGMGLKRSTGLEDTKAPPTPPDSATPPGAANGTSPSNLPQPHHHRTKSVGASSVHSALAPGASSGTAMFTIVSAQGFRAGEDLFVTVTLLKDSKSKTFGKTKHHKCASPTAPVRFDETFKVSCTPDAQFKIEAKGHHTFGSDDDLGDALYFVDETNSGQKKDVKVGPGMVSVISMFMPVEHGSPGGSGGGGGGLGDSPRPPSSGSTLRRSFLSKRDAKTPSREATPS